MASGGNALLVITAKDLNAFADSLISRTRQIVEAEYKDQFYDVKELASLLHVTTTTVYNFVKQGKLSPVSDDELLAAALAGLLGKYIHK